MVATIVAPTRKNHIFFWSDKYKRAFLFLKDSFTSAPMLCQFDPDKEIIVETDASDYVSAGILSQREDRGSLHPVAFCCRMHTPAEYNHEIYEKELNAIIRYFEEWLARLQPTQHLI